jgi:membrane-associated protein
MDWLNLEELLRNYGPLAVYAILATIIFAESGLFFGFFLPGDSLLLTAGLFAFKTDPETGQHLLNLWVLIPLLFAAAVLGDNVGYWFGRKTGPPLFKREESLLFRPKNLLAAKAFYEKHGGKTIILARFMPFIRTFAPIVAGAVDMDYRRFMTFNLVGGALWAAGLTFAGYALGSIFPPEVLDKYFLVIVVMVILISVSPTAVHVWQENRHEIWAWLQGKGRKKQEPEA